MGALEQINELLAGLPEAERAEILDYVKYKASKRRDPGLEADTRAWLDAPTLVDDEPDEWGPEDTAPGRPVRYVEGVGLVIEGSRDDF